MNKVLATLVLMLIVIGNATAGCNTSMTSSTPAARFYNSGDGTVIDTITGLMWRRCPIGYSFNDNGTPDDMTDDACTAILGGAPLNDWSGSLTVASTLSYPPAVPFTDWRLPNIKELSSIIERQCNNPATNRVVFPNTPSTKFWSSTPDADDGNIAWYVDFAEGHINNDNVIGFKTSNYNAYVVRLGP